MGDISKDQNLPEPEKTGKGTKKKNFKWLLWTFLFVCIFFIGFVLNYIGFNYFVLDPKVEQLKNQVSILKSDYEVFENQVADLKKEKKKLEAKITLLDSANRVLLLKTDSLANALSEYSGQIPVTPVEVLVGVSDKQKLFAAFVSYNMTQNTKLAFPDGSIDTTNVNKTEIIRKLISSPWVDFNDGNVKARIKVSEIEDLIANSRAQ